MALDKFNGNVNVNQSLPDQPTLSAQELKEELDKPGNLIKEYINEVLTNQIDSLITNINSQIQTNENRLTQAQVNKIYPVGSLYMSVNNTNPSTLFGGTWQQLKDRFLLGAGNTYANGSTGGEATHILTANEMPSHTHKFTGVAHNHGLNNHTHTYSRGATTTGSTALTVAQIPAHNHTFKYTGSLIKWIGGHAGGIAYAKSDSAYATNAWVDEKSEMNKTGSGQGHTHSISLSTVNTGGASGNTANATATGTNANTGGGQAHNNMPPYLTVYMWKRTA